MPAQAKLLTVRLAEGYSTVMPNSSRNGTRTSRTPAKSGLRRAGSTNAPNVRPTGYTRLGRTSREPSGRFPCCAAIIP